jgi:hypothetical protein
VAVKPGFTALGLMSGRALAYRAVSIQTAAWAAG